MELDAILTTHPKHTKENLAILMSPVPQPLPTNSVSSSMATASI